MKTTTPREPSRHRTLGYTLLATAAFLFATHARSRSKPFPHRKASRRRTPIRRGASRV